jgi:hypothetical protein
MDAEHAYERFGGSDLIFVGTYVTTRAGGGWYLDVYI